MKPAYPDDLIRGAKAKKRISNQTIADKKRMSTTTVSKICNGRTNVELESLIKVADVLGFTVEIHLKKAA